MTLPRHHTVRHNLMRSVSNIWCDILILLLPDIRSCGFRPPRSQCDSLFKLLFVVKDFATWVNKKEKRKKKKLDTHQMLLHTTFPWIRAVTWQPCCLSVAMDTCTLAAERRIKERDGFCCVSVLYDFWCAQLVNAWTVSSHSWGFTYQSHYEDNICFCHRSLAFRQEVQSETGSASEKGCSDRSCVWAIRDTRVFSLPCVT